MKKIFVISSLLFFFTFNSQAKENCDDLYLGETKIKLKKSICFNDKDLKLLHEYKENIQDKNIYPKIIEKHLSSKCGKKNNIRKRSRKCLEQAAGGKVYEIFVKRSEIYHARYPGKIIEGMAWFELLYLYKFHDAKKSIDRYSKYGPDNYQNIKPTSVSNFSRKLISSINPKTAVNIDKKKISSVINMNKGRIKMRKAVGLNPNDNLDKVFKRQITLAEFLNKDKLKVKKKKIDPQLVKREKLLKKYKMAVTKYKEKLEEINQ